MPVRTTRSKYGTYAWQPRDSRAFRRVHQRQLRQPDDDDDDDDDEDDDDDDDDNDNNNNDDSLTRKR